MRSGLIAHEPEEKIPTELRGHVAGYLRVGDRLDLHELAANPLPEENSTRAVPSRSSNRQSSEPHTAEMAAIATSDVR